jgi:hypothetical protein
MVVGSTALVAVLALQLLLARYCLDLVDEGYFAHLADRVAQGELPYRDFATIYTPGVHYLHAWMFGLFGHDLVSMRVPLILVKVGLAALLYVLGRRLMPPAFAALPAVLLFAIDTAPLMWEPHPAWYALTFALIGVWSIARLIETGRDRWVLLAGAAAALACAFKQNIGLFTLLAASGFLIFHSPDLPPGRAFMRLPTAAKPVTARATAVAWMTMQVGFALLLLAALVWLLRTHIEPRIATVFLLPMVALAAAALLGGRPVHSLQALQTTLGRLGWLGGAFVVCTLAWGVPIAIALGPANLPLVQLLGQVDLTGYYWELAEPRIGFGLLLLAATGCLIGVQRFCEANSSRRRLAQAVACLVLAALAADLALGDIAIATPDGAPEGTSLWTLSVRAADVLLLYLPSLAFWGGLAAYASGCPALAPGQRMALRWYLLAGALLLFGFYPRMDAMHVTYSAPLLFVVGAFAMYGVFRVLDRRLPATPRRTLQRGLVFGALLVLPAAATLPNLEWRLGTLAGRQAAGLGFEALNYVPLDIPAAGVLTPTGSRETIGEVVRYLRERTSPAEPIFVYPNVPMFYYLAERPNPTRFGHLYPGTVSPEEQQAMIANLEASRVRYVVWDQYWVEESGLGGKHVLNRSLSDYLLRAFRTERVIGPFHILARPISTQQSAISSQ